MKNVKILYGLLLSLVLLSSCWNNSEIDKNALVHGVGFDLDEETGLLDLFVEIVKPTQGESSDQSGGQSQSVVLQLKSDTPLNGAREFIRYAKRRLYFGHTRLWIVTEQLAKEPFIPMFDVIRRDQMNRLNSYVFITPNSIQDVFQTPTLYDDLSSVEIVSALEQSDLIAEFIPVKLYELIKMNEGPLQSAYIPTIIISNEPEPTTSINGTAVVKNQMMVGNLDINETVGLRMLLNMDGGIITVKVPNSEDKEFISMEVKVGSTELVPTLNGTDLKVDVNISIEGDLGDNIMIDSKNLTDEFITQMEKLVEEEVKNLADATVKKLQKDLKTDITNIGIETYRRYPDEWKEIKDIYHEEVFANATIQVNSDVTIFHQGLTNKSHNEQEKRPFNSPYRFLR